MITKDRKKEDGPFLTLAFQLELPSEVLNRSIFWISESLTHPIGTPGTLIFLEKADRARGAVSAWLAKT